ncbi:MAG: TRAP transporter small permease [Gammaproteobacteria bacterium]|nr:TRAP transporter small permease [Gammaproteobacteria bacterium]
MSAVSRLLDRILPNVLVLLLSAMVVAVTWQVVSRYLLASPSPWTEEVARFLLIWIGMLGAAYAFRTRMHIGLDLLPQKLTGVSAQLLRALTLGVVVLFAVTILIVGGLNLVLLTWELRQTSAALGLPVSIVYSVIPLSGLLIVFYSLAELSVAPTSTERLERPG